MGHRRKLNEAETERQLVEPLLHSIGWAWPLSRKQDVLSFADDLITSKKKKPDYLLMRRPRRGSWRDVLGVLEVKSPRRDLELERGLEQAIEYAQLVDAQFAFSTNGYHYIEYDLFSKVQSERLAWQNFPSREVLLQRAEPVQASVREERGEPNDDYEKAAALKLAGLRAAQSAVGITDPTRCPGCRDQRDDPRSLANHWDYFHGPNGKRR